MSGPKDMWPHLRFRLPPESVASLERTSAQIAKVRESLRRMAPSMSAILGTGIFRRDIETARDAERRRFERARNSPGRCQNGE